MITCPDCGGRLAAGERVDEQRVYTAVCDECGRRFKLTFGFSNDVQIEPILDVIDQSETLAETFPECQFDFPAMLRDSILSDVRCFGRAERCSQQISSAFADHANIEKWCDENNLAIIAKDMRFIICPATATNLRMHGVSAPNMQEIARQHEARIRAEVEAMDWPDVIE